MVGEAEPRGLGLAEGIELRSAVVWSLGGWGREGGDGGVAGEALMSLGLPGGGDGKEAPGCCLDQTPRYPTLSQEVGFVGGC